MTRPYTTMFAAALIAVSCSRDVSRVQTRSLPSPNPTTYSFPLPVDEVRGRALEAFSINHQVSYPIFGHSEQAARLENVLTAECSTNAVFGKAVFLDATNANDIYLHTFHTPFVLSSVYHGRNAGLPFIATFHLHLTTNDSHTIVAIAASDTEVVNGTKFGFGSCGPGQGWNCQRVAPTTVEEYTILRYLGGYLGITNMPEVILPAESP